ncbi:hypothetical protein B0H14DRAFT_2804213 [Mycena olivaceomarginata]|nr:hypothetical protein B0H14DRAFT_2804213 [Mycena olivaceomarginata]
MPPPNNSVAIRVGTTIILALFALWWSVAFSSVFLVSRHFFSLCFLSVAVACLTSTLLFFSLPRSSTGLHSYFPRDDRGSLDLDRVRSLRLAYSFGVITRAMLLM